ncbi:MAG: HEPN domain-containing protein [Candidatus Aenigmatarchaeota archaeon]
MASLEWCKNERDGLQLAEPSENIAEDYLQNAEESLRVLKRVMENGSRIWTATVKYYIEYFCVSAVLARLGISSEIHDCTIEAVQFLEDEGLLEEDISSRLKKSKELRIENQYNLKNRPVNVDLDDLRDFMLKMKDVKDSLTEKKVNEIRSKLFS